jgi:vitamin B12 transporter
MDERTKSMPDLPPVDPSPIVVTASRAADEKASETPASATLVDATRIERIGAPLVSDSLRLIPSVAVAVSGPQGSLTQVRIRGAEANHTLLFVEGIRANDPASGNEPRFELLDADLASRIEVVRGPQSALWGSEAIGGVVAVQGPAPGEGGSEAFVEAGSHRQLRGAARTSIGDEDRGLSLGVAGERSDGIDSFSGDGDKDGFGHVALRGSGRFRLSPDLLLGASGFAIKGHSQFDGFDPLTFLHADTLDESRNRLAAGRVTALLGGRGSRYLLAAFGLLGSSNRNSLDGEPINRTSARRSTAELEGGFALSGHQFVAALESEHERFSARDTGFGGFTRQDRSRDHRSLTVEWRSAPVGPVSGGLAVRHDIFSRFKDATTLRGSVIVDLGSGVSIAGNYGQGIAQPSFFDLFGFFPGSFVGNPGLKPESSRGGEISVRYIARPLALAVTYYRQRLRHEIVDVFDPETFLSSTANSAKRSRRRGIEAEASYSPGDALRLTATYAWLDASEPTAPGGGQLKEQRRPRHSGSVAVDGSRGRLSYGASIAYTGERIDTDFDLFPARRVRLAPYWLADARIAWKLTGSLEAHVRVANAFDDRYQDVVGYRTEGRSIHGGLRLSLGR